MSGTASTINPVLHYRLPKWLVRERYEITHEPACETSFSVTLFDKVSRRHIGSGQTIGAAAKAACIKRDGAAPARSPL